MTNISPLAQVIQTHIEARLKLKDPNGLFQVEELQPELKRCPTDRQWSGAERYVLVGCFQANAEVCSQDFLECGLVLNNVPTRPGPYGFNYVPLHDLEVLKRLLVDVLEQDKPYEHDSFHARLTALLDKRIKLYKADLATGQPKYDDWRYYMFDKHFNEYEHAAAMFGETNENDFDWYEDYFLAQIIQENRDVLGDLTPTELVTFAHFMLSLHFYAEVGLIMVYEPADIVSYIFSEM